jgi:pimeloyl-ACP methyl ester carboxylesterase
MIATSPIVTRSVVTRRGIEAKVHSRGSGPAVVWFHGAGGLLPEEPMLDLLAQHYTVLTPEWPGFGDEQTETKIEDMLDFTLHGWDLIDALDLGERPHVAGHSMGGMIAAEMAVLNPDRIGRLVLVDTLGLWLDAHPVPDIFAMLPFEMVQVLFADQAMGEAVLTAGLDFSHDGALTTFLVRNARRLGTAGKILFPIPNRRLSKRLYRITNPTLLLWGAQDAMVPTVYGERFRELLVSTPAQLEIIEGSGHMLPYEQAERAAAAVVAFLSAS